MVIAATVPKAAMFVHNVEELVIRYSGVYNKTLKNVCLYTIPVLYSTGRKCPTGTYYASETRPDYKRKMPQKLPRNPYGPQLNSQD